MPPCAMHSLHLQLMCRRPTSRHVPSDARQGMLLDLQPRNFTTDCSPLHITQTIWNIAAAPPQPMPTHICFRCRIAITVRMNLDLLRVTSESLKNASTTATSKHITCPFQPLADTARTGNFAAHPARIGSQYDNLNVSTHTMGCCVCNVSTMR